MSEQDPWVAYLLQNEIIENPAQLYHRENVLNFLRLLLPRLNRVVIDEYGLDRNNPFDSQLVPFGSYGLGGHLSDGDIDLAFLAPWPVRRRDFFNLFPGILKQQAMVQDVEIVESAAVPIIRCVVERINVDISFVRLKRDTVAPDINLLDNQLLVGLDEPCFATMDGPRMTAFILQHVHPDHVSLFQHTLQAIKWWAHARCIHDKWTGYLNGSAWAILLLKTYMSVQVESSWTVQELLSSFFDMWSSWPWPAPVLLTDGIPDYNGGIIEYSSLIEFEDAVMPIVTPCYRVSNAAPYATKSTLRIFKEECHRAKRILEADYAVQDIIPKFFRPFHIAKHYLHFLRILVNSDLMLTHEAWLRKMPPNLPYLIQLLEDVPGIHHIRPLPKPFISTIEYHTRQEKLTLQNGNIVERPDLDYKTSILEPGMLQQACYLIAFEVTPPDEHTIDIRPQVKMFQSTLDAKRKNKENDLVINIIASKRCDMARLLRSKS